MLLADWEICAGDAFELVGELDDGSVQLTVTSPPYNIGKRYERRVELDRYLAPYREFARNLFTKTAETGVVCWQVGNYVEDGVILPLDCLFLPLFVEAGFLPRNRIVWHFRHGLHAKRRFSGRHETILVFSKGAEHSYRQPRAPSETTLVNDVAGCPAASVARRWLSSRTRPGHVDGHVGMPGARRDGSHGAQAQGRAEIVPAIRVAPVPCHCALMKRRAPFGSVQTASKPKDSALVTVPVQRVPLGKYSI